MKDVRQIQWYQRSPDSGYVTVKCVGNEPFVLSMVKFTERYVKPGRKEIKDFSIHLPDHGGLRDD